MLNKRIRKKKGIYTRFKDRETWALDQTIAKFIVPRLIRFKKLNNGIPCTLLYDSDNNFNNDEEHNEAAEKEWNAILDEMIWTFKELSEDVPGPNAFENNEDKEAYLLRCKTWDLHIKRGLELFAKYFRDLWW